MKTMGSHLKTGFWISMAIIAIVLLIPTNSLAKTTYDLVIHNIIPAPSMDGGTDVRIFLSVWDQDRKMVKNLEQDEFTITESGQTREVKSLAQVRDEPISVILVLDTSGNPVRIEEEREAAVDFVKSLNRSDIVGVMSFADEIKTEVELTDDHDKVQDKLGRIKNVPEAGTCYFDAAYEAEQQVVKRSGRRAIILITDGEDKAYKSSKSCSANTEEDVIETAEEWNTRVPIFTIAVTEGADEKSLERLAERTGGRHIYVENSGDIEDALLDFSNLFRDEYILTYNTASKPGSYTLVVDVEHKSSSDSDTSMMEITEEGGLPPAEVSPSQPAAEQVETVAPLATAAALPTLPFEATLPAAQPDGEGTSFFSGINPLMIMGIVAVVAALVILLAVIGIARRIAAGGKKKAAPAAPRTSAAPSPDATADQFPAVGSQAGTQIGTLTVLASDDAALIGKVLIVNGGRTSVGRSSENDIVLAGDKAVSREHAIIEQSGERVFLAEVVSQGADRSVKRPLYGTYINGVKVEGVPVELHTGDEIRLGMRMRMRFESLIQPAGGGEATVDEINVSSPGATSDDSGGGETMEYRQ